MPEAAGDELLPESAGTALAFLLVLVDVARGQNLVTGLEPAVRPLGRPVEEDQVAIDRLNLGERTVGLLAVLLDTNPAVEPGVAAFPERQLRLGGDEPLQLNWVGIVIADS